MLKHDPPVGTGLDDLLAAEPDFPGRRRDKSPDHVQQGALATPAGADDGHDAVAFDIQIDTVARNDRVGRIGLVDLAHTFDFDIGHSACRSLRLFFFY